MQLQSAKRSNTKIKIALQGPSGSGKSYSSLLIAYGITGDWNKVAVIDSENESSLLYAHLGAYKVLPVSPPHNPEKYSEAIAFCVKSGIEVIIIDSLSHEWQGQGGILDIHSLMPGNSFTNWSKVTPRHNALLQAILQSSSHVIVTLRTKQAYILTDKNGKVLPEKIGLRAIQREGTDYEFTLVFALDSKHLAIASKDRTGLFPGKLGSVLSVETGKAIQRWCTSDQETIRSSTELNPVVARISDCRSLEELLELFAKHPDQQSALLPEFTRKRQELKTKH